jgi:hypothetical protein
VIELNGYSRELGAQNKGVVEIKFCGRIDCDEARKDYSRWSHVKSGE